MTTDTREAETKYYKFLQSNLSHNGYTYQLGLNIDPVPFNPSGKCRPGGFYLKTESRVELKSSHGMSKYLEKVFKVPIIDIEDFSLDLSQKVNIIITIKDILTIDEKVEIDEPLLSSNIESMFFMEILDSKRTYFVKQNYDILYFEVKFGSGSKPEPDARPDAEIKSMLYGFFDQITEINSVVSKVSIKKQQKLVVLIEELAIGGNENRN